MKYKTLKALVKAYKDGALRPDQIVRVDNDSVVLYVFKESDEYQDDGQCVFRFEGRPEELLIEALDLLGVPAESV